MQLGSSNLEISRLGLGCMGMSEFYGATDDKESIKTIHRAYELGVNHFDTADCYGLNGENEILLGQAIKSFRRDKVVIATKCGFVRQKSDGAFVSVSNQPEYIRQCCENSLRRLGADYIDLFYLHRIDPNTPIELSMQTLSDLVKEGKIRYLGLSEANAMTIAVAHRLHPITAIQSEYSIWSRDVEREIFPLCKALNIGFVAFSPLGSGFLSGKIRATDVLGANDVRRYLPRFQQDNIPHNLYIADLLEAVAQRIHATAAQVALSWVLRHGHVTAIPGTKHVRYLEENVNAADLIVPDTEMNFLDERVLQYMVQGERTIEAFAKFAGH